MRTMSKPEHEYQNKCPKCGASRPLEQHPTQPGRLVMNCLCNPAGPVLETDAAEGTKPKPVQEDTTK